MLTKKARGSAISEELHISGTLLEVNISELSAVGRQAVSENGDISVFVNLDMG